MDGSINKYKAHLVAKGFHQQLGIDFRDTFSLVAKPTTICLVLSLVVQYDQPICQLDVTSAFLRGHPKETVYMARPPSFVDPT